MQGDFRLGDWLILLAAVVTLVLRFSGGFYSEPFGFRVSMRRFERPLLLDADAAVLRS